MVFIAGCVIVRDNKILMVKEAKKKCYGKWNIPAGHMDEYELITEAAIREVYEETGCKVKLTGVLPISCSNLENGDTHVHIRLTADIVEENIKFDTEEILDVQWLNINDVKNMTDKELRACDINIQFLKDFEDGKVYSLEIFNNNK